MFLRSRRWRYLFVSVASISVALNLGRPASPGGEPIHADASPDTSVQRFQSLHGGEPSSLRQLFARQQRGVYVGVEPGLVAMIVSRNQPLNESAVALREFSLASDLILGAIGDPQSVAVLGRERQVSFEQLPPLRAETMIQLAAARTAELAQSYERIRFLAGKYDGLRDWAPILLSDELQDTEYGSLLNITDQLLKSWSQHGEIEYINFQYPKPAAFPFPAPLNKYVKAERITFNWNTKGVGYNDDRNGFDVLAFTRTGSLPVDYLGESDARLHEAEDTGYDFFAGQNDPNLVRVVQYAGIYQIWRKFGVTGSYTWSTRVRGGDKALAPVIQEAVRYVYNMDLDKLVEIAHFTPDDKEAWQEVKDWSELQDSMDDFFDTYGRDAIDDIVDPLLRPRSVGDPDALDARHAAAFKIGRAIQKSSLIQELMEPFIPRARQAYAAAEGRDDASSWIKTPSIVVSWSTGKNAATSTGGHNLYSRVSHFAVDEGLPAGKVRISASGDDLTVFYSAEDAPKIGSSVRAMARREGASVSELEATVEQSLRTAMVEKRPMASALKLGNSSRNIEMAVGAPSRARTAADLVTWKHAGDIPKAHSTMLAQLKSDNLTAVVVERQQGKYLISRAGSNGYIEAPDAASAMDAIAADVAPGSQPTHLHIVGMEPDQARTFAQSVEIQSGGPGRSTLRTSIDVGDGRAPMVVGELRKGNWDWKTVEVEVPQSVIGTSAREVGLEVRVADSFGARARLKVQVVFERVTQITADTMSRINAAVQQWVRAIDAAKEQIDLLLATRQLMNDLKKIDPLISHVETHVGIAAGDVLVVENEPSSEAGLAGE